MLGTRTTVRLSHGWVPYAGRHVNRKMGFIHLSGHVGFILALKYALSSQLAFKTKMLKGEKAHDLSYQCLAERSANPRN